MATPTKMAATMCDFDLLVLLVSCTVFDGWGSSKYLRKHKVIIFNSVFDSLVEFCLQSLATLRCHR